MIDWLRKSEAEPQVEVAGRILPVVLRRNHMAKRMTMRLAPDGSAVRITLPQWGRTAEALEFARRRANWIAGQLAAVPEATDVGHGTTISFCGEAMIVRHDPTAPRKITIDEGELVLGGPAESVPARIKRWLESEARRLMAEDLAFYCARAGQPPARLLLSSAQRRWGSCARAGTIRMNWRLVMAPPEIRRSVVAHEVAHLIHFDHSPAFHALLDQLFEGDLRAANRWLKRHGRGLYQPFG
ncbi:MAG: M48 family metallopeptidase [Novosphingobium sp.]